MCVFIGEACGSMAMCCFDGTAYRVQYTLRIYNFSQNFGQGDLNSVGWLAVVCDDLISGDCDVQMTVFLDSLKVKRRYVVYGSSKGRCDEGRDGVMKGGMV